MMKKWIVWFILAGIWVLAAILNALEQRNVWYGIVAAAVFAMLGAAQYLCDEKGIITKKSMNILCAAVMVAAVAAVVILLV